MQNLFSTWGRRALLAVGLSLLSTSVWAQTWPAATVYKSSTCGCCTEYVKYLRANGMKVSAIDHNNMNALRQQLGTDKVASCHTVKIGTYVVEGHVPVAAIRQMLAQKPNIKGIALPGMPYHSPGMGPEKPGSLSVMQIERNGAAGKLYMRL